MITTSTNEILMVRPASFGFNPETAESNAFQSSDLEMQSLSISIAALQEFDQMVQLLRKNDITVHVIEDTAIPLKPDAIFPNNWISFHTNGQIITYPMMALSRQKEVRSDVLSMALQDWSFNTILRLDARSRQGQYLEGTGSMILDRPNKIVYACLSPRTDAVLLQEWAKINHYLPFTFRAVDAGNKEIYHTNVIMALGDNFAIICLDCIPEINEKEQLLKLLVDSGKTIVPISLQQVLHFAGNMLQVMTNDGQKVLVMSEQAYQALEPDQIQVLAQFARLLPIPLWTIEKYGGGSARCMMAEVFKPDNNNASN